MPNPSLNAVAESGLHQTIAKYAQSSVAALTEQQVLASLKEQGIDSLESLVKKSLVAIRKEGIHPGGSVGRDTFIYTQFIYRVEMPSPGSVIQALGSAIRK